MDGTQFTPATPVNPASLPVDPQPVAHAPGTYGEQLAIAELAAENPWRYGCHEDAYQAARRTVLHHAQRAKR
jgi:hypothetical protein